LASGESKRIAGLRPPGFVRFGENMYDNYAELTPKQRRQAREHGGERSG
jgi:hypothetical protein